MLSVECEMVKSLDGKRSVPISVVISEKDGINEPVILFSSAIFASPTEFDIPEFRMAEVLAAPSEFSAKAKALNTCQIAW